MTNAPARLLLLAAFALGACGEPTDPGPRPSPPAAPAAAAGEAPGVGPVEGVEDACVRARACCAAYVALVGPEDPTVTEPTTCAEVAEVNGDAAQAGCEAAIQGWRLALASPDREDDALPQSCD